MEVKKEIMAGVELLSLVDSQDQIVFQTCNQGAKITQWNMKITEVYKAILTPVLEENYRNNPSVIQDVLFPIPNRLDGGTYSFNGVDYQFPIDEPDKNNAIHGFVRNASFYTKSYSIEGDVFNVEYQYIAENQQHYPFKYELIVRYTLTNKSDLKVQFELISKDENTQPFAIGWHPYFETDDKSAELLLPKREAIQLNERNLPSSIRKKQDASITVCDKPVTFDLHAKLFENRKVIFKTANYEVHFDFENHPYLQLYTPVGADRVAIEPMSCAINAFQSKEGLVEVPPFESIKTSCSITIV